MENRISENLRVLGVAPSLIQIELLQSSLAKDKPDLLNIGSYLKVTDESDTSIIAVIQSYKIKEVETKEGEIKVSFIIDAQPIGFLDDDGKFKRGGQQIAIPPNKVEVATNEDLKKIYASNITTSNFIFSELALDNSIDVSVDGNKFFAKHIAVVGSTGSGKSGTVAKILQEAIKPSDELTEGGVLNNSHIILFDLHGEYSSAFPNAKVLTVQDLKLPYWLMNSEELQELFIESREANSHNQISQFKNAVILNKKKYNSNISKANYDSPVYFSLEEVRKYIANHNIATKDAKTGTLAIENKVTCGEEYKLFEDIIFTSKSSGKINNGPYAGDFDRFLLRIESKLNDERLDFLLKPKKGDGEEYKTEDLQSIFQQFTGYEKGGESNVIIVDLSGIPFEVLSIVVSLISRIIFDLAFIYKGIKEKGSELPFLLVMEEAHNYIPNKEVSAYSSVKKSIERIAKEGRKYGLSLMIVSQRPSEISETIFSQCNNFVVMRLTNPSDQMYVKRLLPDNIVAITDGLSVLEKREAIIIGDSIQIPTIVRVKELKDKPNSHDIDFKTEWDKEWVNVVFEQIVKLKTGDVD